MFKKFFKNIAIYLFIVFIGLVFSINSARAEQAVIKFKDLGINDQIELKTVKTRKDLYFTRSKKWLVSPASSLTLFFQHSPQLLPDRSSLNILINDKIIKTIALTKSNVENTKITVPIPPEYVQDYNKLSLEVNQHYTKECEDPFDASLWTTVLNNSFININYFKLQPETDLSLFPYPIYDTLEYGTVSLNYILPNPDASVNTIKALGLVNSGIAQYVGWKPLNINTFDPSVLIKNDNLVIVGTPTESPAIKYLKDSLPVKIINDKFVDSSGNNYGNDDGILMQIHNPYDTSRVILIISGNSPEGVLKSAFLLTSKKDCKALKGDYTVVKNYPAVIKAKIRDWKEYITKNITTLSELGLKSATVKGVSADPIQYDLKIMPDMIENITSTPVINVSYGYSSNLDPILSNLEVIFNGISIASVKLDNPMGENHKNLKIKIPYQAVKLYNNLVFRYHIYPVKYDRCRFTTDEHIWGTIYDNTSFKFSSSIRAKMPNLGLVNDGGFPFNIYPDMQNLSIVMPEDYNYNDLKTMLYITSRLAKSNYPVESINLDIVKAGEISQIDRKNKNLIVIGTSERNGFINEIKDNLTLDIRKDKFNRLDAQDLVIQVKDLTDKGIIEGLISPWNDNLFIMTVWGQNDKALLNAARVFLDDAAFRNIDNGNVVVTSPYEVSTTTLKPAISKDVYTYDIAGFSIDRITRNPQLMIGWIIGIFIVFSIFRKMLGR